MLLVDVCPDPADAGDICSSSVRPASADALSEGSVMAGLEHEHLTRDDGSEVTAEYVEELRAGARAVAEEVIAEAWFNASA